MTTKLARFTRRAQAFEEDPNWEPDGVTHHVRFCEGPGTTGYGWNIVAPPGNQAETEKTNPNL